MSNKTRRTVLKSVGGVAVVGTLAGCLGDDDEPEPEPEDDEMDDQMDDETDEPDEAEAALRVAHLSPDAPNVDVYIDGDAVLEDVPYREVSDYLEVAAATYEVMITAADDMDTVVFDDELEVPAGEFTIAALGELAEENEPFGVEVYEDDISDPGEEARVRLVHAAPDAPNVDVTVGGEPLFEDVPFGAAGAIERCPATDADSDLDAKLPSVQIETRHRISSLRSPAARTERAVAVLLSVSPGACGLVCNRYATAGLAGEHRCSRFPDYRARVPAVGYVGLTVDGYVCVLSPFVTAILSPFLTAIGSRPTVRQQRVCSLYHRSRRRLPVGSVP